jgi:hypothetical protein
MCNATNTKKRAYLEVDHRVDLDVDIVAGDDGLASNGADLDLYIHNAEGFRAHVDVGKSRINRLVEMTKAGNESHRSCGPACQFNLYKTDVLSNTLLNVAERVREGAARNGANAPDT